MTARRPRLLDRHRPAPAALREELAAGLLAETPRISPKFLYDQLGSRLFAAITELDAYYPTRTEAAIFAARAGEIAAAAGTGCTLVDLGAGDCAKAASLFPALRPARYVAVDIAVDFLVESLDYLQFRHPAMDITGLGCDFSSRLELPPEIGPGPRLLFYPGSSIGNFSPDDAVAFLRQARAASQGGGLLIGFDLVKATAVLDRAYDDELGVTAAFNRNLLLRANRELGCDFRTEDFQHYAFYHPLRQRIEMHLVSATTQEISLGGRCFRFAPGESIHTEDSYKYTVDGFHALATACGFRPIATWCDADNLFSIHWLESTCPQE